MHAIGQTHESQLESLRVRQALTELLPAGRGTCSNVAKALAQSTRTLQRRLEEQGTSFLTRVENYRHKQANLLLLRPNATIAEVAQALGDDNPRGLYRSLRRWTQLTSGKYRRQALSG